LQTQLDRAQGECQALNRKNGQLNAQIKTYKTKNNNLEAETSKLRHQQDSGYGEAEIISNDNNSSTKNGANEQETQTNNCLSKTAEVNSGSNETWNKLEEKINEVKEVFRSAGETCDQTKRSKNKTASLTKELDQAKK
jgi:hypothetical protein